MSWLIDYSLGKVKELHSDSFKDKIEPYIILDSKNKGLFRKRQNPSYYKSTTEMRQ